MATPASREQRVELLGTVQVLHEHLTTSLCQTVFQQTRTTERERRWSLAALCLKASTMDGVGAAAAATEHAVPSRLKSLLRWAY
jgi:hypothetical protein